MISHCAKCGREGKVVPSRERSAISGRLRDVLVCADAAACSREPAGRRETLKAIGMGEGGRRLGRRPRD